ncbi:MAG: gliding motility-associated C-terminal domain-containing protein [Bacteroidales bacterium]|nr:gliding motility-associated C-terminal domain-containing protein [Bacteroidales bacterium]
MKNIFKLMWLGVLAFSGTNVIAQCPEVGYERSSLNPRYVANNWDTAITCNVPSLVLRPDYTVTAMTLNGQYQVDAIPFNPPDTSFWYGRQLTNVNQDDYYDTDTIGLPFPFNFFKVNYRYAVVGPNGNVTFDINKKNQHCQYDYQSYLPIPRADFPELNQIYGIYEDIHPGTSSGRPHQGIYKSVYGEYPCRKLVVSYNNIPGYGHSSTGGVNYGTYQIVCYEGTNIIEVHVKHRTSQTTTNNGMGIIGIQNADGTAAYAAPGRNNFNTDITTPEAWRFTPLGDTNINFKWYRGSDTLVAHRIKSGSDDPGNDTLILAFDTLNQGGGRHGTFIKVEGGLRVQNITVPQDITLNMKFLSAGVNNAGQPILYDLVYTFHVGVDKDTAFTMTPDRRVVCQGQDNRVSITIPSDASSSIKSVRWLLTDTSMSETSSTRMAQLLRPHFNADSTQLILQPYQWTPMMKKQFDTVYVFADVTFGNGCMNHDSVMLVYVHRLDSVLDTHVCQGKSFTFEGHEYSQIGHHSVDITVEGCPDTRNLNLDVKDTNFVVQRVKDCHPYTWVDDSTYSVSTNAPSITLVNRFGCDSTVNLNFTFDNSLHALIEATPQNATLDHLNIQFKDVSLNSTSRRWLLPDGSNSSEPTVYYNFDPNFDSATARLIAISSFGCEDTAYTTIHLLKESIWFPNAFTPGRAENPVFQVKGVGIVSLHVEIFNRRGEMVGRFDGIDGYWDGQDLNGSECPQGAYVYVAKYTNILNPQNPVSKKGTILVIR